MKGKVVLITGANSGIGKETAKALAMKGANIVMICRDRRKGEEAREEIARISGNNSVELIISDLSIQREVRRAAEEFKQLHSRLDVLINNAGTFFTSYRETEDGVERTMAVNYFAPFLLTNMLMDNIMNSVPARVINVSSDAHYSGHLNLEDINGKVGWNPWRAYANSKLALVLFTYELARRTKGTGITVNCLHPGTVRTNIWSHAGLASPLTRLASLFMMSAEKGAETVIYLASSPEVEGVTGMYFEKKKAKRSSDESYDMELASNLWNLSLKLTGLVPKT